MTDGTNGRDGARPLQVDLDTLEQRFAEVEPWLHAFVPEDRRFERLRREEQALEERWPAPATRPPLFGVPVGVKDIFHVDGFVTRAGSALPPGLFAGPEAECVTSLRNAGALILGKTVTTEFATFAPGPTVNPHNPRHTPGGSSSGSAAAVAAGLAPLTLGTQTIGSISRPASFCGVVGFKPSYGRISRQGVLPVSEAVDHVGCFTADVAGARLAASVLISGWRSASSLPKPICGIPDGPYLERASIEGLALFRQVCARLEAAGYEVRAAPAFADFAEIERRHRQLFDGEFARFHAPWFPAQEALYRDKTREILRRGFALTDEELETARAGRGKLRLELEGLMTQHGLDLWLSPAATGPAPEGLEATGDPIMNLPWTHAGVPTVALPAAKSANGLPMGLQLAARFGADEELLIWAEGFEAGLA